MAEKSKKKHISLGIHRQESFKNFMGMYMYVHDNINHALK